MEKWIKNSCLNVPTIMEWAKLEIIRLNIEGKMLKKLKKT